MKSIAILLVLALALLVSARPIDNVFEADVRSNLEARQSSKLLVGVGSADITGPIGELTLFGYADLNNLANGIHLRVRARVFIFAASDAPSRRVVYISTDTGIVSVRTKKLAIQGLSSRLSAADAALYSVENVMVSATHTHSGPGGYQDDFLYQVTNWGRTPGAREAIADGLADAIAQAHADLSEGKVTLTKGALTNGSINRSKPSYLNNPASERAQYSADVDQDMTLLAISTADGSRLRGVVNWFPVHGTSMNVSNHRVSGDNKGYASYRYELEQKLKGNPTFVAAFGQSNAADVSPNTEGAHCTDTGAECDGGKDSCGGNISLCLSRGPEYDIGGDTRSTEVIGERQFLRAKTLVESPIAPKSLNSAAIKVDYRHAWIEYPKIVLEGPNNTKICNPAMGYAFSAGTTDNPATGISYQGDNDPNGANKPLWNFVRNLLTTPTQELVDCHQPKQILLATGEMGVPYDWQPHTLPVQLFVVTSKFAIIGFPAEISTMSGRRLRATVLNQLIADKVVDSDAEIVVAGLSNTYSSYVTTFEEYQVQRYEGGATTYGPNTLKAHQQIFSKLAKSFVTGLPAASPAFPLVSAPKENSDINLLSAVVLDTTPSGKSFGDVFTQPAASYKSGETASAIFACAHPRNGGSGIPDNGALTWPGGAKSTFMTVEQSDGKGGWTTILDDALWDTRYLWIRVGSSESKCLLEWKINGSLPVPAGTYRFKIFGINKWIFGTSKFTGVSNSFTVTA
ncbi:Neutral/alkaline nonlysosomal ceramidase [Cladochytrium replicatum]|nr:Neutral/alkaline nonlysosomal ceramidase [Cladochytrium replicatum]